MFRTRTDRISKSRRTCRSGSYWNKKWETQNLKMMCSSSNRQKRKSDRWRKRKGLETTKISWYPNSEKGCKMPIKWDITRLWWSNKTKINHVPKLSNNCNKWNWNNREIKMKRMQLLKATKTTLLNRRNSNKAWTIKKDNRISCTLCWN